MSFVSHAQLASNRTSETKVADILAKQPSDDKAKMDAAMKELEGFSKEDFSLLLQGLKPQGGKNEKTEYAVNSYSFYVMQPGKENLRVTFVEGLLDALEKIEDKNNKGFIFRMLVQSAKEETVDAVSPYLLDKDLAEKAGRVLNRIGTEKAVEALSHALDEATEDYSAIAIIAALGDLEAIDTEEKIIAQLDKYESAELNKTIYFALSKMGGTKSQKIFEKKLKEVDYQYENDNVAGAAVDYAIQLEANKNKKQAVKFVNKLYKGAVKSERYQAQIAALKLLNKWEPRKTTKKLLQAVDSENAELRHLGLTGLKSNHSATAKILKSLEKYSPEKQESVLLFFAENGIPADLTIIKPFAESENLRVRFAALEAVHKISKQKETQFLIDHLGTGEKEQDSFIKRLILSTKSAGAIQTVNENLEKTENEKIKEVLLEVLAVRRNDSSFDAVYPLTKSNNEILKKKAYQALSNVSSDQHLTELFADISNVSGEELQYTQEAIVSALNYSDKKDQEIKHLSSLISRSSAPSAAKFFPIFSGLGGEEALKAVNNYTESPGAGLKTESFKALANWKDSETLPILLELFKKDHNDKDFELLYKGVISQVNKSEETLERKGLFLRDAFEYARTVEQKRMALAAMEATETYQSLLFAGRFLEDKDLKSAATNTAMNIAIENPEYYGSEVRRILEKVSENLSDGDSESSYLNEAVIRHLDEMPEGEGFVSVFNGKDLTGWKGLVENPIKRKNMSAEELEANQKKADEIMRAGWVVENGELVFVGEGDNIATTKDYGDFEMLVDWKLDKDGKEPDAGIYLRGTPQVQIWDTSRTDVGAEVGSGGLYNNQEHEADPLTVADNPLGEWNTFKIRMVGDKVSVWLNGELVTDEVVLENYWDRSQEIFPKEQIELQAHGSKVYYRDVYIKELPKKEKYDLSEEEKAEGFEMLFDGTDLEKWTGSKSYSINESGELWINPDVDAGDSGSNFFTKEEYDDFVFRFEFKLTEGANNGVGIRAPLKGNAAYEGMEIQILDDEADIYKNLKEYQFHGSVYGVIPAERGALKPLGEWNEEEIHIKGNKIKVTVNGKVVVDGDIEEASKNGTIDNLDHPGLKKTKGHVGFLGHGDVVYFRNIRIKKL